MTAVADDLALALELADLAGGMALARFGASDLQVERKPDGSPVTDADKRVEGALRDVLAVRRPGHAVLGEEEGATGTGPFRWLLDPIDGTSHFVAGDPAWQVLIALLHDDEVIVGVASAPALGTRWWAARGLGAFRDGARLRVSAVADLGACTVHDDWSGHAGDADPGHPATVLAAAGRRMIAEPGDGFLAVADGRADVCLSTSGKPWDFAAAQIIAEEAGGRFTDLAGRRTIDSGHALVSNGVLHDAALAAVARA